MAKENDEEKSSDVWSSVKAKIASAIGFTRSKEDPTIDRDVDEIGTENEGMEEDAEILFSCLVEEMLDDEVVVRLVRNC